MQELPIKPQADREEPSITEVNGTVARFEMAYNMGKLERHFFGPTQKQMIFPTVYLALGVLWSVLVLGAYGGAFGTRFYEWLAAGDEARPVRGWAVALFIAFTGVATFARARMRGILITDQGMEARYILALGVPKIRRWAWAQVDRFIVDERKVMIELWNNTYEILPEVKDRALLLQTLEKVCASRKKVLTRLDRTRAETDVPQG